MVRKDSNIEDIEFNKNSKKNNVIDLASYLDRLYGEDEFEEEFEIIETYYLENSRSEINYDECIKTIDNIDDSGLNIISKSNLLSVSQTDSYNNTSLWYKIKSTIVSKYKIFCQKFVKPSKLSNSENITENNLAPAQQQDSDIDLVNYGFVLFNLDNEVEAMIGQKKICSIRYEY